MDKWLVVGLVDTWIQCYMSMMVLVVRLFAQSPWPDVADHPQTASLVALLYLTWPFNYQCSVTS